MGEYGNRSLTIIYPGYTAVRHFLHILDGVSYDLYRDTSAAMKARYGSHRDPLSWSNPDAWIPQRLEGEKRALAQRIWDESGHELNPRYLRPPWRLTMNNDLLTRGNADILQLTERGRGFLKESAGRIVAEVDEREGVLSVLQSIADLGPGKRADLLPEFVVFCETYTTTSSASSVRKAWYKRIVNLMKRDYVRRQSYIHRISEDGLQYLEHCVALLSDYQ